MTLPYLLTILFIQWGRWKINSSLQLQESQMRIRSSSITYRFHCRQSAPSPYFVSLLRSFALRVSQLRSFPGLRYSLPYTYLFNQCILLHSQSRINVISSAALQSSKEKQRDSSTGRVSQEEWDRTTERTPIPSPYYSLRIWEWNINETCKWRGNQMKDELADRRGHSFNPSSKSKRKQDKMILNSQWLFTFHWLSLL